jgi:hypothetical protein
VDTNSWRQFRTTQASYGGEMVRITNGAAATEETRRKKKERTKKGAGGPFGVPITLVLSA